MRACIRKPVVTFGVKENDHVQTGMPTHAVVFTCIEPGIIIQLHTGILLIKKKFLSEEEARNVHYQLSPSKEDLRRAARAGEQCVQLVHLLKGTNGLSYLYILPTGLVALLWPSTIGYALEIIAQMKTALTEVCGELDFYETRGQELIIPTEGQIARSKKMGILLPV